MENPVRIQIRERATVLSVLSFGIYGIKNTVRQIKTALYRNMNGGGALVLCQQLTRNRKIAYIMLEYS